MVDSHNPDENVFRNLRDVVQLFTRTERRWLGWFLPMFILTALMQVVGIASIIPFLQLVSDPDQIRTNQLLARAYALVGSPSETRFLVYTGIGALVVLVASDVLIAVTEWLVLRFTWGTNDALSRRLLEGYLGKPYEFFLNENTAALVKNMLNEVRQVVSGLILPGMQLLARGTVALAIMILLVAWNPALAIAALLVLGGAYGAFFALIKGRLKRIGRVRARTARSMYMVATEALSGAKEIKLLGREAVFVRRYGKQSRRFARTMTQQNVIAQLPRYALEIFSFGGLILIVVVYLSMGRSLDAILPVLGLYAVASYRLLPALQSIFNAIASIRFSSAAFAIVKADLTMVARSKPVPPNDGEPLPLTSALEFRDLAYRYPGASRPVLNDLNLRIDANTTAAFVGSTGSGKTTSIDLLLGLLRPHGGGVYIDGELLTDDKVRAWQDNLGYVPQQIYLTDDTIANNIALGVDRDEIDMGAVERAARMANIHDFVISDLPDGYDTVVGERGVRLSGGQRQRLGIARALYRDPSVLVLDEATSALDTVTEEAIFAAVEDIARSKTVIMIAHRISTVRNSDVIFVMDHGVLVDHGSYDELIARSAKFRALASVEGSIVQSAELGVL